MIRNATLEDLPTIIELGKLMHEESAFAPFDFDTEKVSELVHTLIAVQAGIAIVAEEAGQVIGGFIGAVHSHWFGNDSQSTDYALFIAPAYRSGRTGLRLIKEYVIQAKSKGAKQIMLANSTGYQPERVAKLFESMGFIQRGYVFEYANA